MDYRATAFAKGGRKGWVKTESGSIDSKVVPPGGGASGVTPEELLAGAWGACYGGAYAFEANAAGLTPNAQFRAEVVLSVNDGIYEISSAELTVLAEEGDSAALSEVAAKAHERCPVSKVFRNGIGTVRVEVAADV